MSERRQTIRWGLGAAAALLLSCTLLSCTAVAIVRWTPWLSDYQIDCTIGASGTAATVEFHGWRAGRACRDVAAPGPDGKQTAYRDAPRQGSVICRGRYQGLTVTVRDVGILDLEGSTLCQYFGLGG